MEDSQLHPPLALVVPATGMEVWTHSDVPGASKTYQPTDRIRDECSPRAPDQGRVPGECHWAGSSMIALLFMLARVSP
jgi:hypothetical protein